MLNMRFAGLLVVLMMTSKLDEVVGQSISVSVKGGIRASEDFHYAATSDSRRYVVGPAVEATLPLGFAIEFDALYRRQGYSTGNATALYSSSIREADNVWEFPLLARYRIPLPAIRPFAEVGWAPRIMHGYQDTSGFVLTQLNPPVYSSGSGRRPVDWPATHGLVVGGGIQFSPGRLQFAPEVRYIHWNQPAIQGSFPDGPGYGSNQNQLDLLLGIRWRIRTGRR
jgi:hypothetical protein